MACLVRSAELDQFRQGHSAHEHAKGRIEHYHKRRQSGACGWGNFVEPSGDRQIIYIDTCIKVPYQNFATNER